MQANLLGNAWLCNRFGLEPIALRRECRLGTRSRLISRDDVEQEDYTRTYDPGDAPLAQVEFALKYDHLRLDILRLVFRRLARAEVVDWVARQPTGKWARRVGYLYEWLTGDSLDPQALGVGGNYAPLLDDTKYLVAARPVRVPVWRIEDNLLGEPAFCPVVRRTPGVDDLAALDATARLKGLADRYPPELFRRAVGYLYQKETRSSYDIERETPSPERVARFVSVLHEAGKTAQNAMLAEARLVELQNLIVDPRYAQARYRDTQNYIGQTLPDYRERVHYVPPPPQYVAALMQGLADALEKSAGSLALARAALIAFGFVFVHPFDDGNGRLHRFLIHDLLAHDGFVPQDMLLPVSAWMLKHPDQYDRCLEAFSRPLMALLRYELDDEQALRVLNPEGVEDAWRFPDMTAQVEYLGAAVNGTLEEELVSELNFLSRYDEARRAMREVVDLPDRKLDLLIRLLHQNHGGLSKSKREKFAELTEAEIAALEARFREAFVDESPA